MREDSRPTARRRLLKKLAEDGIHAPRERREEQADTLAAEVLAAVSETSVAAGRA